MKPSLIKNLLRIVLGLFMTIAGVGHLAFQRQEFINPYEDIQVSTLQADQQTDSNLSNTASSVDALRRGGTRTVLGGIPRVNESGILLQNMISQDLEKQDLERSYKIAQGEEDIRAMREQREQGALLGLGQPLQVGRQDSASGLTNLVSGGLALGSSLYPTSRNALNTANRRYDFSGGLGYESDSVFFKK